MLIFLDVIDPTNPTDLSHLTSEFKETSSRDGVDWELSTPTGSTSCLSQSVYSCINVSCFSNNN